MKPIQNSLIITIVISSFLLLSCDRTNNALLGHWYSEQSYHLPSCPSDWYFRSEDSVLYVVHLPIDLDSLNESQTSFANSDTCSHRLGADTYRMMRYEIKKNRIKFEYCHGIPRDFSFSYHNDSIIIYDIYNDIPTNEIYQKDLVLIRVNE